MTGERSISSFAREKKLLCPKSIAAYMVSLVLVVGASLVYIYPSIKATSLMYDYSSRLRRLDRLKEVNKKLVLETAALRSYDFIEERATHKFGFIFPEPGQVVIIAKK